MMDKFENGMIAIDCLSRFANKNFKEYVKTSGIICSDFSDLQNAYYTGILEAIPFIVSCFDSDSVVDNLRRVSNLKSLSIMIESLKEVDRIIDNLLSYEE